MELSGTGFHPQPLTQKPKDRVSLLEWMLQALSHDLAAAWVAEKMGEMLVGLRSSGKFLNPAS